MATDALVGSPFSWNLVTDFQYMWSYPFMVNAFRAGTLIAVAGALVGYFVVVRRQTFAAHSLAMISFPGASGALLLGVSTTLGALGFCVAGALLLAAANRGGRSGLAGDSAATGTLQACALALGYLFANLYHGFSGGITNLLFGQITGITSAQVAELAAGTVTVAAALAVIGRPLLLASVDPMTARASGVPVRGLDSLFLVLVGVAVAQAGQITGALLVFSLVVLPAATAQQLTTRPGWALAVSVVIGFVATWVGLIFSYYTPYPPGPAITTLAFVLYVVVRVVKQVRRRSGGVGSVVAAAAADGGSGGVGGLGGAGASGRLAASGGPGSGSDSGSGPGSGPGSGSRPGLGSGSGSGSAPGSGSDSVASDGSGTDRSSGELSGRASGATSGTADH